MSEHLFLNLIDKNSVHSDIQISTTQAEQMRKDFVEIIETIYKFMDLKVSKTDSLEIEPILQRVAKFGSQDSNAICELTQKMERMILKHQTTKENLIPSKLKWIFQDRLEKTKRDFAALIESALLKAYLENIRSIKYMGPLNDLDHIEQHERLGLTLDMSPLFPIVTEVETQSPASLDKRIQPGLKVLGAKRGDQIDVPILSRSQLNSYDLFWRVKTLEQEEIGPVAILFENDHGNRFVSVLNLIERNDPPQTTDKNEKAATIEQINTKKGPLIIIQPHRSYFGGFAGATDFIALALTLTDKKTPLTGIVLDLRNPLENWDGVNDVDTLKLLGVFLGNKEIGHIRLASGDKTIPVYSHNPGKILFHQKLVVLVSKNTSPAGILMAETLRRTKRAIIAGDSPTQAELPVFLNRIKLTHQIFIDKTPMGHFEFKPTRHDSEFKGVVPSVLISGLPERDWESANQSTEGIIALKKLFRIE